MTDHLTSSPFDPAVVAEPDLAVFDDAVSAAEHFPADVPSVVPSPPMYMPPAIPAPAIAPSAVLPQSPPPAPRRRGKLAVIAVAGLATIAAATFGGLYFTAKADLDDSKAEVSRLSARIASQQDELDLADTKTAEMQSTIDDQAAEVEQLGEDLDVSQHNLSDAESASDRCRTAADDWQDQSLRLAKVLDALAADDLDTARSLMKEVADNSQDAVDATAACHTATS